MADKILLEFVRITLEDGSGHILTEAGDSLRSEGAAVADTDAIQLEDASGDLITEGTAAFDLTGTSTGQSSDSASIRARVRYTGSSTGHSTTSATMRARVRYIGTSAAHSGDSATLRVRIPLTGSSAAHSGTSATIRSRIRFTASSAAHSTTAATLTYIVSGGTVYFTGTSTGQSATSASIRARVRFTSTSVAHSTTSAILTYIGPAIPSVPRPPQLVGMGGRWYTYGEIFAMRKRELEKTRKAEPESIQERVPEPVFPEAFSRIGSRPRQEMTFKPLDLGPVKQSLERHVKDTAKRHKRREREAVEV